MMPTYSTYSATKAAVEQFASLSALNRLGEGDDIAKVIVFLAGDDAKWIS